MKTDKVMLETNSATRRELKLLAVEKYMTLRALTEMVIRLGLKAVRGQK